MRIIGNRIDRCNSQGFDNSSGSAALAASTIDTGIASAIDTGMASAIDTGIASAGNIGIASTVVEFFVAAKAPDDC